MNINLIDNLDDAINLYAHAFSNFNPNVIQIADRPIIIRKNIDSLQNKVVILSGGGSGHEPGHAGFIGHGMLTGAVLGGIFASPPANTILESIYQIGKDNKCGVLLIVKNYTGDRINFNIAAERARKLGILVEIVIVGEDTATQSENTACGRRGLAGTVLIHKIAGAMAEKGLKLKEIKNFLNKILQPGIMGTIGISFTGSIISQKDENNVKLSEGMYELGLGIHGEAGIKRQKFKTADLVMKEMIKHVTASGTECVKLKKGDEIVVLINNLGSCTHLELFLMADSVIKYLKNDFQVSICRAYCGSYLTSLQMYGVSITILKVTDKLIIEYLDFSCDAPGWNGLVYKISTGNSSEIPRKPIFSINKNINDLNISINKDEELSTNDVQILVKIVISACDELIKQENYLNELDKEIGDADCGTTFKRGATAVKKFFLEWNEQNSNKYISVLLSNLSYIIENQMGGSSGGLLSLLFASLSTKFKENQQASLCDIFLESAQVLSNVGGAKEGDRTMLDVIFPVLRTWKSNENDHFEVLIPKLANTAQKSSDLTMKMKPKAGRASYVKNNKKFEKYPDPGAEAINLIIKAIKNNL